MSLTEPLSPVAVLLRPSGSGKKQVLQSLTEAACAVLGLEARAVFDAVLLRERLSGTGIGDGVALPHARATGLSAPAFAFARVETPLDFQSLDGRGADLIVLLLTPADRGADHLKSLARLSRVLRRADVRERLRAARTPEEVTLAFGDVVESDAA